MPATTPPTQNCSTATSCSAVLALSATLMFRNNIRLIIVSMPKVIRPPGSTRVIQSKKSKGTKGSSASWLARYISPMSGAVSKPPKRAPSPNVRFHIVTSSCAVRTAFCVDAASGSRPGVAKQDHAPSRLPMAYKVIVKALQHQARD